MSNLPPEQFLWTVITSHVIARCVHVVAEYGVADAMTDRPMTAAELAVKTGMNADALQRMLCLLAAQGVFTQEREGYRHTPASELLRTDHPRSLRALARMFGTPVMCNDFTQLASVGRTGRPVLDWAGLVAYFADHPDESRLFNQAMVSKSARVVPAILAAYDFSRFRVIADIGGGRGHLLQEILERAASTEGVLFDLPHVINDVDTRKSERMRLQAGNFFTDDLPRADAYILMEVIHDWADDDAVRILSAVRRAALPKARLLIVESLVSEAPGPHSSKVLDVIMLAVTGGRERTSSEYEALLERAGFRVELVIATPSQYSVIEAVAAGGTK